MNNGTLKGDDTITKENLEQVKDYLNNNFPSMDVACEINDGQLFLEFSGQKFVLDPNTKVNELIYSFNQYVGNDTSNAPIIVDNDTYYRRNKRQKTVANVKNYRIDIDPDLYNSYSESLNNIASNISTTAASFDDSMFSDKLATFYSGLGVDNTKDMEGAKSMIEDLSMKIKYSVQLYENTDDELQYFFNSMVNRVFAYDDFKNGGSVEYLSFEDREKNIQNYIDSMKDLYNSMYNQYIKLYGKGIPLETEKVNQMLHLFDALGAFSTQDGFTDLNLFSYKDYEGNNLENPGYQTFADTQYFNADYFKLFMDKCEDKNCIQALKNYIDGKDWYSSGMDDSFGENLRTMWSNYSDGNPTETDAELIFLNRYFGKQKNNKFYDDYHLHGENSNPEIANSYLDFQTFVGKRQNVEDEIDYIEDVLANWGKEGYTEKDLDYYFIPKDFPSGMNPYSKEGTQYILNYLKTAPTDEILNYTQETTTYFDHLRNGLSEERNVTEEKWFVGGNTYTKESFRNNSIMREFFGKQNENNVFYYDEIDDREGLTRYFKSYIKDQKILETYDYISNETTTCLTLRQQMMSAGSQVYNLEQYQKLMPFEDIKKDPEYLKYLGTQYDASGEFQWYDQSELAIYHYVYDKEGFDAANKYLQAMDDTVNQRKGFVAAAKYVELLNSGHEEADILRELSPLLGDVKELLTVTSNTATVGLDGFAQGIFNFGKGFYNLVNADGVRDASDYAMAFKAQLLSSANEYNENIPDYAREIYYHTSQVMSSVGNMFIPMMLSAVPTIGPVLSKTTLFLSSFGNNLESSLQEGYSGPQAYLYSALSSSLELATESILGSIPGIGGNAPTNLASQKGWNFLKTLGMSMYDEGKEEFIQSYAEAGLRYLILGEPIDLSQTTADAVQSFVYGAISSGIMNLGTTIPVKLKNGSVVNVSIDELKTISQENTNNIKNNSKFMKALNSDSDTMIEMRAKDVINMNVEGLYKVYYSVEQNIYFLEFVDGTVKTSSNLETDFGYRETQGLKDGYYFTQEEVELYENAMQKFDINQEVQGERVYTEEEIQRAKKEILDLSELDSEDRAVDKNLLTIFADQVERSMRNGNPYAERESIMFTKMLKDNPSLQFGLWDGGSAFMPFFSTIGFNKNSVITINDNVIPHEGGHAAHYYYDNVNGAVNAPAFNPTTNSYMITIDGKTYNYSEIVEGARLNFDSGKYNKFFDYIFQNLSEARYNHAVEDLKNSGVTFNQKVAEIASQMKSECDQDGVAALKKYGYKPKSNGAGEYLIATDEEIELAAKAKILKDSYNPSSAGFESLFTASDICDSIFGGTRSNRMIGRHGYMYYGGTELHNDSNSKGVVNQYAENTANIIPLLLNNPSSISVMTDMYGSDFVDMMLAEADLIYRRGGQ